VRDVLGEGAVYLIRNDPALLADAIAGILRDRKRSAALAEIGQANVSRRCARGAVASQLALFVSGNCLCD
jgi:hypothetical protein